jgi:hypothetical protein
MVAALFLVSASAFAQENYLIETDTSTTIMQVYPNALVGRILVNLFIFLPGDKVGLEELPDRLTSYSFNGIDATGTLHINKSSIAESDDYKNSTEDNYVFNSMSIILPLELVGPRIEIDAEASNNGELSITLTNAEEFEVYSE